MSKVREINDLESLNDTISSFECVVVDFQAPSWCVPCKRLHPHFVKAAEQVDGEVIFVTVDIDKAPDIVAEFGIMSVPTVKMFCEGEYQKDLQGRTVIQLLSEIDNV